VYYVEINPNHCSWATSVKNLLQSLGFNDAWLFQGVGNENAFIKTVKQRLKDVFIHKWIAAMTNSLDTSNRAKTYLLYAHFRLQPYLINVNLYKFRRELTRLRVSAHRLEVETGRWYKPRANPYPNRKCIACNKLEDEFHFMLECPLYKDIRKIYIK